MNRIQYIDRLKGVAILLVVMGHVSVFCYHVGAETMSRFIGSFHMPLFMFLSGIVIKAGTTKIKDVVYWIKKIGSLLLPLCVFGSCFILFHKKVTSINGVLPTLWLFVSSSSKWGYWYLFVLPIFYATMPIFFLNKNRSWFVDVAIFCFFEVVFYIGWKPENTFSSMMCLLNATCFYPYFFLGYMVRKYNMIEKLKKCNWLFSLSLISYIFMFAFPFNIHVLHTLTWRLLMPLTGILTSLFLFVDREYKVSFVENQLSFLGKHTLDIYVLHYFFLASINLYSVGSWFQETNNGLLATVLAIFITVFVAYISVCFGQFLRKSNFMRNYAFGEIFKKK